MKWDLSVTQNISVGGVRFTGSNDFQTINKTIRLKIKIPELSLPYLELEADVLSAQPRFNGRTVDIRAKFINISEAVKKELSVLENSANFQMA